MKTFAWLTPPEPAAIAVVSLPPIACLDRTLPEPGHARFARLVDSQGPTVDEVIACRVTTDRLDLHVHGGAGVRAAVTTALSGYGLNETTGISESPRWDRLARAMHPAAVALLLANRVTPAVEAFLFRAPVVLIAGPANAGKSTLLNAWCGRTRALVADQPGTTRDLVTAEALTLGWRLRLIDSAGERVTSDPLEQAGQELAAAARDRADLVVYLQPPKGGTPRPGDLVLAAQADQGLGTGLPWSIHGAHGRSSQELLAAVQLAAVSQLRLMPL